MNLTPTQKAIGWILLTMAIFGALLVANYLRPEVIDRRALSELGYTVMQDKKIVSMESGLVDHAGQVVGDDLFRHDWSLVFFGFTYCPDVCPTTLSVLNRMQALTANDKINVVLVSVDPERDTPAVLAQYVTAFNPTFTGVTGEGAAIRNLAMQLQVMYEKEGAEDVYLMNHSSHIAVINPQGVFTGFFSIPHEEHKMASVMDMLM